MQQMLKRWMNACEPFRLSGHCSLIQDLWNIRYFLYSLFPRALDIRESLLLSIHFFTVSFLIESWNILNFKQRFIIFMVSVFIVKAKIYDALESPLGFSPSKTNATLKTMVVSLQLTRNSLWNINCTRNIR